MGLPLSPAAATQAVIWGGLLIGLALGAAAQATRFCTMGALADWFSYGGTARLMMGVLAVAVAASSTLALISMGWFDPARTVAWSDRFLGSGEQLDGSSRSLRGDGQRWGRDASAPRGLHVLVLPP